MIELRLLGTLDLRDRATGVRAGAVLAQPKRLALLCHLVLATSRGLHRRDRLLALFWPDSPEDRARNSLNQAVFNLRRSLGEAALVSTPEELGIAPGSVWSDVIAFEQALDRGDRQGALELYGGELMPGFHLDGGAEFEQWLDAERERLRRRAVGAALETADELERGGNGVGAVELLRRGVAWAPYDESAVGRLVALLARLGDRVGALNAYERFRTLLAAELEIEPSPDLAALALQLREDEPTSRPPHVSPNEPASQVPHGSQDEAMSRATPPSHARASHSPAADGRKPYRRLSAAGLAAAAVLAVMLWFGPGRHGAPAVAAALPPLDARRVLVAAFENRTGDAALDPLGFMAADWIAQGLARTGIARVVPFSTVVQETPHLTAEGVAPEVALLAANRQLARRIGAGLLIVGSYYLSGEEIVLQAQVTDVATGELLRALDEVRGAPGHPAPAVERLQRQSLGTLAVLLDERLHSWPDPGGQPASLEAYRLFSEGMGIFMRAMDRHATPEGRVMYADAAAKLGAATALDSAFTTAALWAGYAHMNAGDVAAAAAAVDALERRPLSAWSGAVLRHQRAGLVGDAEAAYEAAREVAEMSPDSEWLLKRAVAAYQTGRPREALEIFLRMDPDRGWLRGWSGYWRLRAEVRHMAGDYAAVLDDVRRGLAADPDDSWLHTQELWALAALGRGAGIAERLAPRIAAGDVRAAWQLNTAVEELRGHRHDRAADRLFRRLIPLVDSVAARDGNLALRGHLAHLLNLAGRIDEAAVLYRSLLALQPRSAEHRVRLAILEAARGDLGPARDALDWLSSLAGDDLARAVPAGELAYWGSPEGWLALMQARLLAQTAQPDRAVEMVRAALARGLAHAYLHLHDDPDFAPLRGHSAFDSLLLPRG